MSWSLSTGRFAREDVDAAVDAAQPSPPLPATITAGYAATYTTNVEAGKAAVKALVSTLNGDFFTASLSGHVYSIDSAQGNYPHDAINLSVSACPAPEPEAPTPAEAAEAAVEAQVT